MPKPPANAENSPRRRLPGLFRRKPPSPASPPAAQSAVASDHSEDNLTPVVIADELSSPPPVASDLTPVAITPDAGKDSRQQPPSKRPFSGRQRPFSGRQSLVARIVGYFLLLSLVAALLVPTVTFFLARQTLQESVFARLEVAATLKQAELTRWVEDNKADVSFLAWSPEFKANVQVLLSSPADSPEFITAYEALSTYLSTFLLSKPSIDEILILSEEGKVLLATVPAHEGSYRSTDTYFIQGLFNTYVQNIYTSLLTGKPTMTIAAPLLTPVGGQTIGVLAVHLDIERLDRIILERTGLGETGETYLIDRYNAFVSEARFAAGQFPRGVHTPGIDLALTGENNQGAYTNYLDTPVLGLYRWIPDRELVLVAEISQSEAFAPATRLAAIILALGLGSVLFLTGGAVFVARQIARPILAINTAARGVASGDLTQQAPVLADDETGALAITFNQMTNQLRELVGSLETRVAERTQELEKRASQLQAAAEVGKAVASMRNLDELLQQITRLISDRFDYYHVGIFLLDPAGENALLRAANSPGGQRMLERGHKLAVGQKGIVGYVTGNREPRIAMDVGQDAVFFDNPDLPTTRSEMALPLIAAGKMLGALDVQSTAEAAFSQEDIATLQVLADQVAIAIENANLFAETQSALEMTRRAYGEVSRQAWDKILRGRPTVGYTCDRTDTIRPVTTRLQPEILTALQSGGSQAASTAATSDLDSQTLLVPFHIHGHPGGLLRLRKSAPDTLREGPPSEGSPSPGEGPELPEASAWSQREIELVQALAVQLGQALEGAQLYSDSQRRAVREQLLGEVTASMRESLDVDEVLRTAVQQMRRALSLAKVEVRLQPADTEPAPPANSERPS